MSLDLMAMALVVGGEQWHVHADDLAAAGIAAASEAIAHPVSLEISQSVTGSFGHASSRRCGL